MTREQKIEALADEIYPALHPAWGGEQREAYIDGILAGIRLRDEELLAMEFDSKQSLADAEKFFTHTLPTPKAIYVIAQQYQHEQFMKLLKGDKNEG